MKQKKKSQAKVEVLLIPSYLLKVWGRDISSYLKSFLTSDLTLKKRCLKFPLLWNPRTCFSSSFISRSWTKVGFLERTQAQPKSHHFLMELPAFSPMEERDLDLCKAHEVAGEEEIEGWSLREREESLLLKDGWLLSEGDDEIGKDLFVVLCWIVWTIELIFLGVFFEERECRFRGERMREGVYEGNGGWERTAIRFLKTGWMIPSFALPSF